LEILKMNLPARLFQHLFQRFFRTPPPLEPEALERLERWRKHTSVDLTGAFDGSRYVVVDVETTGLDLSSDRLIAIGACAMVNGKVSVADSFEVVLRQDHVSSRDNILIHGIAGETQREGVDPVQALLDFLDFLGESPLVAFHVAFDETMIRRAMKTYLGLNFKHPWLDLAYVLPGLLPEYARRHRALDDWTGHFGIGNFARHSALADALSTAQLFQCAIPIALLNRARHYKSLQDLEKAQRWIN
jgi:DNA polymerase III subunit epsilon